MKNEDLILFIKEWSKKVGENKANDKSLLINIVNKLMDITSYSLAQFINR